MAGPANIKRASLAFIHSPAQPGLPALDSSNQEFNCRLAAPPLVRKMSFGENIEVLSFCSDDVYVLRVIQNGANFLSLIRSPLDVDGIHPGTSFLGSPQRAVTTVLLLFLRASVTSPDVGSDGPSRAPLPTRERQGGMGS